MAPSDSMALDGNVDLQDEPAPRPRSRRRLLLIVGAALVLLIAGGAGAYVSGVLDSVLGGKASSSAEMDPHAAGNGEHGAAEDGHQETVAAPVLFDLPDFVVNLNVPGRKSRFLKLKSRLVLSSPEDAAAVERALPRIVDVFQVYLRELRPDDLRGSEGTYRLREALVRRVGAEIGAERVRDVLFVELFVQ